MDSLTALANNYKSKCKVKYHFFHKLMEPYVERKGFESYFWYLKDDIKHRMYLSRDAKKMLEVIQNRLAIVWHDPEMDKIYDFRDKEGL